MWSTCRAPHQPVRVLTNGRKSTTDNFFRSALLEFLDEKMIRKSLIERAKRLRARSVMVTDVYSSGRREQEEKAMNSYDPWTRRAWRLRSYVTNLIEFYGKSLERRATLLEEMAGRLGV